MGARCGDIAFPILRNLENYSPELIGIMGIIKKIIGAVLGLLAAIGGLVGIGGKGGDGYFLDLSQDQGSGSASTAPAPTPKVAITPGAGAQAVTPAPTAQATESAKQPEMPNAAQAATAKEQKAAIKEQKAAAKASIEAGQQALEAKAADAAGESVTVENVSFADVMMVPGNTMSKRRPGPSLAGFQEMAKEMATKR